MSVVSLDINSRRPYEGGVEFGQSGAYERLDGTVSFAVDPEQAHNVPIVDLELAQRDVDGRVRFSADFCLLQPADPARGNRRLLFEAVNRGRKLVPRIFNHAAPEAEPTENIPPGDGFLMCHGWTVAWCGWQWDVAPGPALMGLRAPRVQQDGRPIEGRLVVQIQPVRPVPDALLADRIHTPYPTANLNDPRAELTVRDWRDGPSTVIPRGRWRFAKDVEGRPVSDPTRIWLEGGFEAGKVYEVVYRTRECPVVGTGLLAIRDTSSFLRYSDSGAGNPCAGRIDRAYAFGMSQSGRFLRHLLHLGLNLDEAGRQVFDGVLPHVAGSRRGEFNHRFAQPSVQATRSFGHLPPFTGDDQTDPKAGHIDGLFHRQREIGGMPRVISTNTSAEYWRGDGSLIHTDMTGGHDVEPSSDERIYLFAGTQHGPGALPLTSMSAVDGSRGLLSFNVVDYVPLIRAALVNLARWVSDGVEPPPSSFPRIADGTAVPGGEALVRFRDIPGITVPDTEKLPTARRVDLGPDAEHGVGRFPAALGEPYPNLVSAVDDDGNESGGIRMPAVAEPVATYTGWNPRDPVTGGAGQIINMQGSTLPFVSTPQERKRIGDPRRSIAERYRDRDDYLARARVVAVDLADRRYILNEDIDLAAELAAERYDAFAPASEAVTGG